MAHSRGQTLPLVQHRCTQGLRALAGVVTTVSAARALSQPTPAILEGGSGCGWCGAATIDGGVIVEKGLGSGVRLTPRAA